MGLNGYGHNSGCRWTTLGRDADRKEQPEQSSEMIVKEKKNEMDSRETKRSNRNEKKTIKNKTPNVNRGQRSAARRWASSPCQSVSLHPISSADLSKFWSAIFTLKIRESPQFLRRNRIWILPVEERRATNQADRSFYTAVNSHCTQNRGYTDTFWTGFGFV